MYWHQRVTLLLFLFCIHHIQAQFNPCQGKAPLGETCDKDTDCDNKGSVCLRGSCQCHPYYVRMTSEKMPNGRCVTLPSKIGQDCSTKCREPLFCRNGKCQCVQRGSTFVRNGECVSVTKVGDRCTRHYDCTSPFSACVNQQCTCISGTIQQGTKCVASTNCPLGGTPAGSCIRKASLSQIPNFVPDADTCNTGHYCVTTPDSQLGHCCPQKCPLGSDVDRQYTCIPGEQKANNLSLILKPCPSDTHYCHYLAGDSFAQAVCCKRPCNAMAPEALYLNGACVSRGQLNSECKHDEQCGAAEGMECRKGQCECAEGFREYLDPITNPKSNPSQLCVRECEKSAQSRDTTCLSKSMLGGSCFVQGQCPENSGCYRGRCLCSCGYRMTAANKCIKIEVPTTQATPQAPIVGNNDFLQILNGIFGGKNGGGTGSLLRLPQLK